FVPTLPAPPCSSVLPYTTLFRSHLHLLDDGAALLGLPLPDPLEKLRTTELVPVGAFLLQLSLHHHLGRDASVIGAWQPQRFVALDRKSTRLNSSHVKISYAVFCL